MKTFHFFQKSESYNLKLLDNNTDVAFHFYADPILFQFSSWDLTKAMIQIHELGLKSWGEG